MQAILLYTLASIIGVFSFLFIYWKRIREDYSKEIVFGSGFSILIFTFIGGATGMYLSQFIPNNSIFNGTNLWFWTAFLGYFISFLYNSAINGLKFFESLEASLVGLFIWLSLLFSSSAILLHNRESFISFAVVAILFVIYSFLERNYRKFTWYKSGRVGFSGLVTLGLFFLLRSVLSISGASMVSLAGRVEIIFSSVVAFLLFFSVYHLSEKY